MKILITKELPASDLAIVRSHGWDVSTVKSLDITLKAVSEVPVADVWIVSSRNSITAIAQFKHLAPLNVYVIGHWLEGKLRSILPGTEISSFENMTALVNSLAKLSFASAVYFCADNHRAELEDGLTNHRGAIVKIITHVSRMTFPVLSAPYNALMVFSPRAVDSILTKNKLKSDTLFLCIGPTTERYLHTLNFKNTFCSSYPDATVLINEFFASRAARTRNLK